MEEFDIEYESLAKVRWIEYYLHEGENLHSDGTYYIEFHGDYGTIGYLDDVELNDCALPDDLLKKLMLKIKENPESGEFNWELDLTAENPSDVETVNKMAKARFGLTSNFNFAGYLLIDGTMLNFSENGTQRTLDHRSIGIISGMDIGKFIELGNIRTLPESGCICLNKRPTPAQYNVLKEYFRYYFRKFDYIIVEVVNTNMDSLDYYEYEADEGWNSSNVINDMEAYFSNGKKLGNENNEYDDDDIRNFLEEKKNRKKKTIKITRRQLYEAIGNVIGSVEYPKTNNGGQTNLSRKLYEFVRTSGFKKWFGDWQNPDSEHSLVVDDNGEPMLMFHGSNVKNITKFKMNNGSIGTGAYFTSSFSEACDYVRMKHGKDGLSEEDDGYMSEDDCYDYVGCYFLNIRNRNRIANSAYGYGEKIALASDNSEIMKVSEN